MATAPRPTDPRGYAPKYATTTRSIGPSDSQNLLSWASGRNFLTTHKEARTLVGGSDTKQNVQAVLARRSPRRWRTHRRTPNRPSPAATHAASHAATCAARGQRDCIRARRRSSSRAAARCSDADSGSPAGDQHHRPCPSPWRARPGYSLPRRALSRRHSPGHGRLSAAAARSPTAARRLAAPPPAPASAAF